MARRVATAMRPISRAWNCEPAGFSFLEVLIALAVLSLLAAVVFRCHYGALRAEQLTRRSETAALLLGSVFCERWQGQSRLTEPDSAPADWRLIVADAPPWECWRLESAAGDAPPVTLYFPVSEPGRSE